MVMSMVTELAALVSLGVGDGVADPDALGLAETETDGLGVALVASGLGLAVPAGALVQPISASPVNSPPNTSPAMRRPVGELVIGESALSAVRSWDGRVEVT
jgi:hypothetical protein